MEISDQNSSDSSSNSLSDLPLILEHRNSFNIELKGDNFINANSIAGPFESWQENCNNLNMLKQLSCPNFLKDSKKNSIIDPRNNQQLDSLKRNSGDETAMDIEKPETGEASFTTPKTSSINHILGQIRTNQFQGKDAPVLEPGMQRRIDQLLNAPCRQSNKDDLLDFWR